MASNKKRHKAAKQDRLQQQAEPPRQRDGDRRRRGAISVDKAIAEKRLMLQADAFFLPDSSVEGSRDSME
jgi:hypothetical protein